MLHTLDGEKHRSTHWVGKAVQGLFFQGTGVGEGRDEKTGTYGSFVSGVDVFGSGYRLCAVVYACFPGKRFVSLVYIVNEQLWVTYDHIVRHGEAQRAPPFDEAFHKRSQCLSLKIQNDVVVEVGKRCLRGLDYDAGGMPQPSNRPGSAKEKPEVRERAVRKLLVLVVLYAMWPSLLLALGQPLELPHASMVVLGLTDVHCRGAVFHGAGQYTGYRLRPSKSVCALPMVTVY